MSHGITAHASSRGREEHRHRCRWKLRFVSFGILVLVLATRRDLLGRGLPFSPASLPVGDLKKTKRKEKEERVKKVGLGLDRGGLRAGACLGVIRLAEGAPNITLVRPLEFSVLLASLAYMLRSQTQPAPHVQLYCYIFVLIRTIDHQMIALLLGAVTAELANLVSKGTLIEFPSCREQNRFIFLLTSGCELPDKTSHGVDSLIHM
ncbi:hypothetical protein BC826DRAFT_425470 [Russula brevipes]|nr:hypothetical protein BC826DRAFT_425470 [Russula brevipes]